MLYRVVVACYLIYLICEINYIAKFEKYLKKRMVLLDENYVDSEKIISVNNKQKFD